MNLEEKANKYGKLCDPCNETLEKQADIRQGYKKGYTQCKTDLIEFLKVNHRASVKDILKHLEHLK